MALLMYTYKHMHMFIFIYISVSITGVSTTKYCLSITGNAIVEFLNGTIIIIFLITVNQL